MLPPAVSTFRARLTGRLFRGRRPVLRALSLLLVPAFVALAACAPAPTTQPSYAGDFPDPSVIHVGGLYFAFSTQGAGGNIQRLVSTDHKNWVMPAQSDALPVLPSWADSAGTWAPDVEHI